MSCLRSVDRRRPLWGRRQRHAALHSAPPRRGCGRCRFGRRRSGRRRCGRRCGRRAVDPGDGRRRAAVALEVAGQPAFLRRPGAQPEPCAAAPAGRGACGGDSGPARPSRAPEAPAAPATDRSTRIGTRRTRAQPGPATPAHSDHVAHGAPLARGRPLASSQATGSPPFWRATTPWCAATGGSVRRQALAGGRGDVGARGAARRGHGAADPAWRQGSRRRSARIARRDHRVAGGCSGCGAHGCGICRCRWRRREPGCRRQRVQHSRR